MPYADPLPLSKIIAIPSGNPNYRAWPLAKITFGISKKKQQDLNDLNKNSILPSLSSPLLLSSSSSSSSSTTTTTTTSESSILVKTVEIIEKKSEPQMIKAIKNDDNKNIESDVDRDNALKQVKDILSTSPQLSTSPSSRRRSSPEVHSRKLSLKVDLSSTQQQFTSEMSPCLLRKKSGEILKPSLKRGKSEPVTPIYSYFPKYVRFDATNLERVKLFDGAQRPQAVSAEVSSDEDTDESDEFDFSVSDSSDEEEEEEELIIKIPTLPLMTTEHYSKYVFVESIFLSTDKRKLQGRIHVKNIAFHKLVQIRYTFDFWQTVSEVTAKYATTNAEGGTNNNNNNRNKLNKLNNFDLFHFSIELIDNSRNPIDGKVMYFAVHYQVNGCDYWDNNNGQNYQVNFKRVSSNQSSHQSISQKKNNGWSPSPSLSLSKSSSSSSSSLSSSSRHVKALEAGSPPAITKNITKKSSRYDLSVSLSAAKNLTSTVVKDSSTTTTTVSTTTAPSTTTALTTTAPSTTAPSSSLSLSTSRSSINNNNNNNNLKTPLTPGDNPINQYFPTISYGNENYSSFFPGNYIDGMPGTTEISMSAAAAVSSWDDVKSSSNPITIPSTKTQIGSSAYYDLVNQYCFYQGSPYTAGSPYASSPFTSSPSVLT